MRPLAAASCVLVLLLGSERALGGPLLPRPQSIRHHEGAFPLRGASVQVIGKAAPEDRFAAEELAALLSARVKRRVPIAAGPRPIVLRRTGAVDALPTMDERGGPEGREAYSLIVTPRKVEIAAASSAGVYWAVKTLQQLVDGNGEAARLPAVSIRDWPALVYRGFMMDMSHMGLPTEEEVKRQIDLLARYKVNQYFFYSEASIDLEKHPLLTGGARFTQDEVRRIVAHGRQRHVDVVPCFELFGHLHDVFRIEHYADLSVMPHDGEFDPLNPRVASLLGDWADEYSALFPSPLVHIGFDEPWALQESARRPGAGTPADIYVRQFKLVYDLFRAKGKRVGAWGDIMMKHPEIIARLPRDVVVLPWAYRPRADYKPYFQPFAQAGLKTIAATGVLSWNWIVPDVSGVIENTEKLAAEGRRHGNTGLLNTGWTDDLLVLMRSARPAMAYGAAAAWNEAPFTRAQLLADYGALEYGPAGEDVRRGIEAAVDAQRKLQEIVGDHTINAVWADPFARLAVAKEKRLLLREARLGAETAQVHFRRALQAGPFLDTLASWLLGAQALDYCALRYIYALEIAEMWERLRVRPSLELVRLFVGREIANRFHSRATDLIETSLELRDRYREAWLREYRPYRMAAALARWDDESAFWNRLRRRMNEFSSGYSAGMPVPPLAKILSEL